MNTKREFLICIIDSHLSVKTFRKSLERFYLNTKDTDT